MPFTLALQCVASNRLQRIGLRIKAPKPLQAIEGIAPFGSTRRRTFRSSFGNHDKVGRALKFDRFAGLKSFFL